MDEIKVFNSHTKVEIFQLNESRTPFYTVQILTPQGYIRQSFGITPDELDLVVTALLMLKKQLDEVSQA